jgi:hypothetical protein
LRGEGAIRLRPRSRLLVLPDVRLDCASGSRERGGNAVGSGGAVCTQLTARQTHSRGRQQQAQSSWISPRRRRHHVTFKDKLVGSGSDFGYTGRYHRGAFSSGFNWSVRQYREGTIIIDVVDRAKDQLVWRGWMTSRNRDGNFDEAEINRAVNQILARFPPGL